MGLTFTSICAQASRTAFAKALRNLMNSRGYRTDNKNPELSFSLNSCGGKWYCLKGDFPEPDNSDMYIQQLSQHLSAPVLYLHCLDSDFIWLQLHHDGKNESACIGSPHGLEPPTPVKEGWQDFIYDFDHFQQVLHADFTLAEEMLVPLGKLIGFDGSKLLCQDENISIFGFSKASSHEQPYVESGSPRFGLGGKFFSSPKPYKRNQPCGIPFLNLGGPGKGLTVIAESPDLNRSDVYFEAVSISHGSVKADGSPGPDICRTEGSFVRRESRDGCISWVAEFPEFEIPKGLNLHWKSFSPRKRPWIEYSCSITIRFILHTPIFLSELRLTFIPCENPDGFYTWDVKDCRISPEQIESYVHDPQHTQTLLKKIRIPQKDDSPT